MGTAIQRDRPGRGRLPRRAVRGLAERPGRQQRPADPDPARHHRRHPPRVPRGRRRHHRDQHVQRQRRLARPTTAWRSSPTSSTSRPPGWPARECDAMAERTPDRPRFVAGALGPTTRTASISPRRQRPRRPQRLLRRSWSRRTSTAARGLVDGGADLLFIETIFDTLNAKAAIFAVETLFEEHGRRWPVVISGTITDASGRTLSGQVTEAFWNSVRHARPLAVGLNCALGAKEMRPYLAELSRVADTFVSVLPERRPAQRLRRVRRGARGDRRRSSASSPTAGFVNIVGGCCGTTPDHIARDRQGGRRQAAPRACPRSRRRCGCPGSSR